jgi:hypothetical protein
MTLPTASYPTTVKNWTALVDLDSVVVAADPNTAYSEIIAIETALGVSPTVSATWGATSTLDIVTTSWTSVAARIQNIENGLYGVSEDYVSRTSVGGHNVITPTGTSTVNLTLKAQTSQTANIFEARNASNTIITKIDSAGLFQTSVIDGGTP